MDTKGAGCEGGLIWRWEKEGVPVRRGGERHHCILFECSEWRTEREVTACSEPSRSGTPRVGPSPGPTRGSCGQNSPLIGWSHRARARGAAVDEVLPPSGLVADMVVGVCLESERCHECQHACFNQEPSSITNTALLNGKTFLPFNCGSRSPLRLDARLPPRRDLAATIFPFFAGLRLAIYNTYVAKWQIDNLDNERRRLIALCWQADSGCAAPGLHAGCDGSLLFFWCVFVFCCPN